MTTNLTPDETAADIPQRDHWPRWRVWTIRVWYGLLSLWALSFARGVVVVALGQAGQDERFGIATSTAWKLLAAGAVIGICWTGGRSVVAFQALVLGTIGWSLSEVLWAVQPAGSTPFASTLLWVVLWFLPLLLLRPHRRQLLQVRAQPSAILLPLALACAVPLVIYALRQGALADDPAGTTVFYDTTELGVVLAVQAVFAALRPHGGVWLPRFVALAAAWIGLAAIVWPADQGTLGRGWGAALIGWALAFAVAAEMEARRHRPPAALE